VAGFATCDAGLSGNIMSAILKQATIIFRPMSELDLEQVIAIEEAVYEFPWSIGIFQDCLSAGYCCWLMEQDECVSGYGVMSVLADEAHILNLCIKSNLQNNGLGKEMLDYLIDLAKVHHADVMFLEVRPSNRQALKIYEKSGFDEVGSRKDYYPAKFGREDALILAKQLTDHLLVNH
jgi:ribosomal-protein-alanine N-acetyltransferase